MDDVAAKAGVSRALVSLVMRDSPRVSSHNREKVLAVAADLGYRPNMAARNLATGETKTIGVMLNDIHNPFFTAIAEGASTAAGEAGMQLVMSSGWLREAGETEAIEMLLGMRTDGLLLASPRLSDVTINEFATQAPTVILGVWGRWENLDSINNDEQHGAELIVDHLVGLGHTRIAHIAGNLPAGGQQRRAAFAEAMVARGLAPIIIDGDFNEESGYEGAGVLMSLNEPPTAIFAGNDLSAIGVLSRLHEMGIRVPDDVSVVGYDDTNIAGISAVSLTTVHQPREEIGFIATQMLLERIAGRTDDRHEDLEPRLVVRQTTGPATNS